MADGAPPVVRRKPGFAAEQVSEVRWRVETDRMSNFQHGQARVTQKVLCALNAEPLHVGADRAVRVLSEKTGQMTP